MTCEQLINGPFLRHQFLGASVQNWSVSSALNQESTSVTVQLIEDCGPYSGVYYDASNASSPTPKYGERTDSFCKPPPGMPVIFRLCESTADGQIDTTKGFEYAGVVQNWNTSKSAAGETVISVQLTDPSFILEGVQVICSDLAEKMTPQINVLNVFGAIHKTAGVGGFSPCASSPAGGINPAVGPNGILWADLREYLMYLTSDSVPDSKAGISFGNPQRRIKYTVDIFEGVKSEDTLSNGDEDIEFMLDLSQMPVMPSDYRLSLTTGSVLDIISEVCTDAGVDFWIELLPVKHAGGIEKVLKVRTIDRKLAPALKQIEAFKNAKNADHSSYPGGVFSSISSGIENSDQPTSYYLYGAHKLSGLVEDRDYMIPFFGFDSDGVMNRVITSPELLVSLDATKLNEALNTSITTPFSIKEAELQGALSDFDSWEMISHAVGGDVSSYLDSINQVNRIDFSGLNKGLKGEVPSWDTFVPNDSSSENKINDLSAEDAAKLYDFVKSYADTYYGKQYFMDVTENDNVCKSSAFSITNGFLYDFDVTNEGFFQSETDTFVGGNNGGGKKTLQLTNGNFLSDVFKDDLGKFGTIVQFSATSGASIDGQRLNLIPDPTKLDDGEYLTDGAYLYIRGEIEERWYSGTPVAPNNGDKFGAVVKLSAPVFSKLPPSGYLNGFAGNAIVFDKLSSEVPDDINIIDRGSFVNGGVSIAVSPQKAVIPVRSNHETYGPWYNRTADSSTPVIRKSLIEQDDSYAPWEFGVTAFMNAAAYATVDNATTAALKGERGSLTFAGIPKVSPNSELMYELDDDPKRFLQNRTATLVTSSTATFLPDMTAVTFQMDEFDGSRGPVISNMNINFGTDGFTTQYQFNTYSQQFGKFAKLNADRLKRQGRIKFKQTRSVRSQLQSSFIKTLNKNYQESFISRSSRTPKSAHHCLIGRYAGDRVEMNSQAIKEANILFSSGQYQNTSIMSWDGVFMPVSRNATLGNLPGFVKASGSLTDCDFGGSARPVEPPTEGYSGISITVDYLDPVSNSTDTIITDARSDSSTSGHKFEILARDSGLPSSGWSIQKENDEKPDYRFMAMRGPLVLQAWGYDTQGKPVPNSIDDEEAARSGNFANSGITNKFLGDWLQKPKTWPVAPVDLRLDRERGVWTIPTLRTNVHVSTTGCIATGTGNANSVSGENFYPQFDQDGAASNNSIDAYWPWAIKPPEDIGKTPIYYDTTDCKYYFYPTNKLDILTPEGENLSDVKAIQIGSGFDWNKERDYSSDCPSTVTLNITPSSGGGGSGSQQYCYSGVGSCDIPDYEKLAGTGVGCLGFSTGLFLQYDNTRDISLVTTDLWVYGVNYTTNCDATEGAPVEGRIVNLRVSGDLSVAQGDTDCDVLISGFTRPLLTSNSGDCTVAQNPNNTSPAKHIVAGTGLQFTVDDCRGLLNSTQTVQGTTWTKTGSCNPYTASASVDATLYNGLIFAGSLSTTFDGCNATISGIKPFVEVIDSGLCSGVGSTVPHTVDRIIFGSGTRLVENYDDDKCGVEVHTSPFITGVNYGLRESYPYDDCGNLYDPSGQVGGYFNSLTVAGNISLRDLGACEYEISGFQNTTRIKGAKWLPSGLCNPYSPDTPFNSPIEGLIFTGYLSAEMSGCSGIISGVTPLIDVWDSGLCNGVGATALYSTKTIIFGSGLETIQKTDGDTGECLIQVHNGITAEGVSVEIEQCSGLNNATIGYLDPVRFQNIKVLGTGLSASYSTGDCTFTISGYPDGYVLVNNTDTLCGAYNPNSYITDTKVRGIVAGTGLRFLLFQPGGAGSDCSSELTLDLNISGAVFNNICDSPYFSYKVPNLSPKVQTYEENYTGLNFIGNLSTTTDGCSVTISGAPGVLLSGMPHCGAGATSLFAAEQITIGTGLIVQSDGCKAILSSALTIGGTTRGTGNFCSTLGSFDQKSVENIVFQDFLTAEYDSGTCTVYVSGAPTLTFDGSGVCGRDAVSDIVAQRLTVGTGLFLSVGNDCGALIQSAMEVQGTDRRSGGSTAVDGRYEILNFVGPNLSVHRNGCETIISGVDIDKIPSGEGLAVCGRSAVTAFDVYKTQYGSGLQITDAGGEIAIIESALKAQGTDRRLGAADAVAAHKYETLNFVGANLSVHRNGCETIISGVDIDKTPSGEGLAACGRGAVAPFDVYNTQYGTGLEITNAGGDIATIQSALEVLGTDRRGGGTSAVASHKYETLEFVGSGLSIHQDSNCKTIISGALDIDPVEGSAVCGRNAVPEFNSTKLLFGSGIQVVNNSDVAEISSAQKIQGTDRSGGGSTAVDSQIFENLTFGDNLSLSEDGSNCGLTLSGVPAVKVSGIANCGSSALSTVIANQLDFGSGLTTTATADGVQVDVAIEAGGTDRRGATTGGAAVSDAKFTSLSFSEGGISTYYDEGLCQFVVSGVPLARIAGQEACGRAVVGQFDARRIDLGTGLQLVNNGNIAEISTTHTVDGTNEKTGGAAFSVTNFEKLNFEAGISVSAGTDCEVLISGIPRVRVDGLASCGRGAVTQAIYENISVGTGLSITNQGDTALIVSEVKAQGTDKRGGGSSAVASQRYENLNFIGGISVHEGSNCELFVSGIQSAEVNVAGAAACGRGAVAQFQTDTFEFGTGLQVVNNAGTAFVDSTLSAQGTDKRGSGTSPVGPSLFENLNFIGNLSVHEGSNCEVFVSGISAGVSMSGLGQCGADDYLKEDVGTIRVGSGLVAEAGGTIHKVLDAEGLTFAPREAYPCDSTATSFSKKNISGLTFAGNISIEDGGCGNLIVSGIPSLYSGIAVCGRSAVPVFEGCVLGIGTGLQLSENDGKAILHSTLTYQQTAGSSCYGAGVSDATPFENIVASGFSASIADCTLTLNHTQDISKSVQGSCHWAGAGNSTFTAEPFKTLDFGTGFFVTVDGCTASINAGMLAYGTTQCEDFSTAASLTSVSTAIGGGYGINVALDASAGCNAVVISQNLSACSTNIIGQSMTKSASDPYPDATCSITACGDGTWDAGNGPFEERRPPKAWGEIIAGPGIGITAGCSGTSDGDCTAIFYSNQILTGKDTGCDTKVAIQNYKTNYDCDFNIERAQGSPSAQFDGADWTQESNIKLSEMAGCSWEGDVGTGIITGSTGGYLTSASLLLARLEGTKSCNGKYWLKGIPDSWEQGSCTTTCTNPL